MLQGEMLRYRSALGQTHHVGFLDALLLEQLRYSPNHCERVVGNHGIGRSAGSRHVEHDEKALGDSLCQRNDRFDIRANFVEEEDGPMLARLIAPPGRGPQCPSANVFHRDDSIFDRIGHATLLLRRRQLPVGKRRAVSQIVVMLSDTIGQDAMARQTLSDVFDDGEPGAGFE
jgi:hypothetical protein